MLELGSGKSQILIFDHLTFNTLIVFFLNETKFQRALHNGSNYTSAFPQQLKNSSSNSKAVLQGKTVTSYPIHLKKRTPPGRMGMVICQKQDSNSNFHRKTVIPFKNSHYLRPWLLSTSAFHLIPARTFMVELFYTIVIFLALRLLTPCN